MNLTATSDPPTRKPLWRQAYVHVILAAIAIAIAGAGLGALNPALGTEMKPLADGFIALIQLAIALLIFLVVATGVAQVGDMREVGRIGLKAIIYFEAVTTIALLIGLAVGDLVHFSNGVAKAPPGQAASVAQYSKAHAASLAEFLTQIIPNNLFGAFVHENVLQVLVIALLVGAAIVRLGDAGARIRGAIEAATSVIFGVVNIIVMFAPIGAFGALGFTVGRFGVATLYSLGLFVLTSWLALAAFVFIVLGLVCRLAGVSLLDMLGRLKREMIVTFATSSSESAMPGMMERLQQCGIARPVVGLVVPTGFPSIWTASPSPCR
jgi:aerobic C4-dicarboxylate transport protein